MTRKIPFLVGLAIVLVSGLAHGVWTGRWRTPVELEASVAKLAAVPAAIGDWRSTELSMDDREKQQAGIKGAAYRRYENPKTGAVVTMFLVSGPPGKISVHSPEVCYPGVGYVQQTEREEVPIDANDKFWAIRLSKRTALAQSNIVVYYGWNADGEWKAPAGDPRFNFAWFPVLYKMYIVQELKGSDSKLGETDGAEFAKVLLPVLKTTLFGKSQG